MKEIICGDSRIELKKIASDSVDCIITDPPYFMLNSSGKGFMGKSWDSINEGMAYDTICGSKEYANFVKRFFRLMMVDSSMEEESSVHVLAVQSQEAVQTKNAKSVKKNSNHEKKHKDSVPLLVLTKHEVLELLKCLNVDNDQSIFQSVPKNVLFAVPHTLLGKKLKDIVAENVLKCPIELECKESETQLTLTAGQRINAVIEAMIGNISDYKSTNETTTNVSSVENIVNKKRYRLITLPSTGKQKIIQWLILLLYATSVIQKQRTNPKSTMLDYEIVYQFHKNWATECVRVLKPGAFAFVMTAPRQDTLSPTIRALSDAGFVTSFTPIFWSYATGFPKATNISKAIDKKLGVYDKREKTGVMKHAGYMREGRTTEEVWHGTMKSSVELTAPYSEPAKKLHGSFGGHQPKPAVEVIVSVMKPLSEKNYTEQAMKNGKGITWLDDCKIPYGAESDSRVGTDTKSNASKDSLFGEYSNIKGKEIQMYKDKGRFPANLLVSDSVLDTGNITKSTGGRTNNQDDSTFSHSKQATRIYYSLGDIGDFSRYFDLDAWAKQHLSQFFITPKPATSEKEHGLEKFLEHTVSDGRAKPADNAFQRGKTKRKNTHPTIKPISLMSYLVKLGSREGDLVLDPFLGSGTTAIASEILHRNYIGIEKEQEYVDLVNTRIKYYKKNQKIQEWF